jgi:aspartyl-tRNA(Asn)/glutamyl-tRNA(Gln) amidotransferase subunit A
MAGREPFRPETGMNIELATAWGIRESVLTRRASAEEVTRATLARLDAHANVLNCFLQTFHTHALEAARQIDRRIADGHGHVELPLAGVPIAIKDNLCLGHPAYSGARTTCASRMLEHYESPFTATAVQKLIDAGAVIIGKTNMDEFAMGSSGENSAFGPTRNPWDPHRVPGGSSSGSASCVAAGIVPASLGSDTGGSIRQPAGHCGIMGLKPTYGRVSRYGLVAYASSLDQVGPMARSVLDCALILSVLCGHDPRDSTSSDREVPNFTRDLHVPVEGLTLGVPRQAISPDNHPAVADALEQAVRVFESMGARIVEVDLPHTEHSVAAYYIVAPAEASSNLARYDGIRYGHRTEARPGDSLMDLYCRSRAEGFGKEVQRRIMLGTYVLSAGYYDAYYTTALRVRRRIKGDYDAAFAAGCHAILLPSSPTPAFRIGEKSDPLSMYLEDIYTVGANLAGLPGITVPAGFAAVEGGIGGEGGAQVEVPVGLQLIGAPWQEHTLLRIARMFENATEHHLAQPPALQI